jgi:asparagine synthase (glutamine-hydrolysing)
MCGIFGVIGPEADGVSERAALEVLAHRGPDAKGIYRAPGVLLGHRRLAIVDLSPGGAQPMHLGDTSVVFNGMIYNHQALRKTMPFTSKSDTEAILRAYQRDGHQCVRALDGFFAFALWDNQTQTALLARDRTGKKPLFYSIHQSTLYFASEQRALESLGIPLDVDEASLSSLMAWGYLLAPDTLHRGIFQLPPGTSAVFKNGTLTTSQFYRSPFRALPLVLTEAEAVAQTRRLVEAAIERRLEADVPLGAFLSGGIDSSIIAGVMQRKLGKAKTFSIGFDGDARFDETNYARLAAKTFGTEHTEFRVDANAFEKLDDLVLLHDGPFGDSSAIPTSIVSELTKKHVTVALSGDGGDELFAGYPRFFAAAAAERIPKPLSRAFQRLSKSLPQGAHPKDLYTRGIRFARGATAPMSHRLLQWTGYFVEDLHLILKDPTHLKVPFDRSEACTPAEGSALQRALAHNFETYLPGDLLVKADRASMAHALEVRAPFLDTDLVAFAARLPDRFRRQGRTTKWVLRKAFEDLLPTEILNRGKMGFSVPLSSWFRGPLKDTVRDRLHKNARCTQWLQWPYIEQVLEQHAAQKADHSNKIWLLLTLESWLNRKTDWSV